jgi:hypothetical protein
VTTEMPDTRTVTVLRTCKIIARDGSRCGNVYRVVRGSTSQGCPDCAPELPVSRCRYCGEPALSYRPVCEAHDDLGDAA